MTSCRDGRYDRVYPLSREEMNDPDPRVIKGDLGPFLERRPRHSLPAT